MEKSYLYLNWIVCSGLGHREWPSLRLCRVIKLELYNFNILNKWPNPNHNRLKMTPQWLWGYANKYLLEISKNFEKLSKFKFWLEKSWCLVLPISNHGILRLSTKQIQMLNFSSKGMITLVQHWLATKLENLNSCCPMLLKTRLMPSLHVAWQHQITAVQLHSHVQNSDLSAIWWVILWIFDGDFKSLRIFGYSEFFDAPKFWYFEFTMLRYLRFLAMFFSTIFWYHILALDKSWHRYQFRFR